MANLKEREKRIEELEARLRRGCAGPAKFAQRKLAAWAKELRRLKVAG